MNTYTVKVDNPFGPFSYSVIGLKRNSDDTDNAAAAFEKALDFFSRAPHVSDVSESIIQARQEIEKRYQVTIKPDF